jgi:hypothetical protein
LNKLPLPKLIFVFFFSEVGGTCIMHEGNEKCIQNFHRENFGGPKRVREINIKMSQSSRAS